MEIKLHSIMGDCRTIANAAWTSTIDQTKKESKSDEDVARVVKMLIRDHHTSPLESVVMTFICKIDDSIFSAEDRLETYKNVTIHKLKSKSKLLHNYNFLGRGQLITLNFHALIKYKDTHSVFKIMYEQIRELGCMAPAIEQLEELEGKK